MTDGGATLLARGPKFELLPDDPLDDFAAETAGDLRDAPGEFEDAQV